MTSLLSIVYLVSNHRYRFLAHLFDCLTALVHKMSYEIHDAVLLENCQILMRIACLKDDKKFDICIIKTYI